MSAFPMIAERAVDAAIAPVSQPAKLPFPRPILLRYTSSLPGYALASRDELVLDREY